MSDLIERQAAIDLINDIDLINFTAKGIIRGRLQKLPSAQPEPKTAHWVPLDERFASWSSYYKCSECGFRINLRTATDFSGQSVNYCPHCGLQMKEDEK